MSINGGRSCLYAKQIREIDLTVLPQICRMVAKDSGEHESRCDRPAGKDVKIKIEPIGFQLSLPKRLSEGDVPV